MIGALRVNFCLVLFSGCFAFAKFLFSLELFCLVLTCKTYFCFILICDTLPFLKEDSVMVIVDFSATLHEILCFQGDSMFSG